MRGRPPASTARGIRNLAFEYLLVVFLICSMAQGSRMGLVKSVTGSVGWFWPFETKGWRGPESYRPIPVFGGKIIIASEAAR
jgi:hypothetical protein